MMPDRGHKPVPPPGDNPLANYEQMLQTDQYFSHFRAGLDQSNSVSFLIDFQRRVPARCLYLAVDSIKGRTASVIDVECSAGDYYGYLDRVFDGRRFTYTGVDPCETAITAAQRHYDSGIFETVSADDTFEGRSADVVLSINIMYVHPARWPTWKASYKFDDELAITGFSGEKTDQVMVQSLNYRPVDNPDSEDLFFKILHLKPQDE